MNRLNFISLAVKKLQAEERKLHPTKGETALVEILTNWNKYKFEREYSVASFFLDTYIPSLKLGIEADGGYHEKERDYKRDNYLRNQYGISILRLHNDLLINEPKRALEIIKIRAEFIALINKRYPKCNAARRRKLPIPTQAKV